jgi:hypothetical protein
MSLIGTQYNSFLFLNMSEWLYLTPNEQFFSYIVVRTIYIQWDDDDVRFVLD